MANYTAMDTFTVTLCIVNYTSFVAALSSAAADHLLQHPGTNLVLSLESV